MVLSTLGWEAGRGFWRFVAWPSLFFISFHLGSLTSLAKRRVEKETPIRYSILPPAWDMLRSCSARWVSWCVFASKMGCRIVKWFDWTVHDVIGGCRMPGWSWCSTAITLTLQPAWTAHGCGWLVAPLPLSPVNGHAAAGHLQLTLASGISRRLNRFYSSTSNHPTRPIAPLAV